MDEANKLSVDILKKLVPLGSLTNAHLAEIAATTSIKYLIPEKKIFKQGQSDNYRIYVLKGMVVLESTGDDPPKLIKGGSEEANYPLDHHQPHRVSAITKTNAAFVVLKDSLVEKYLTMDQAVGFSVDELDDDQADDTDDWMTRILSTKTFSRIPPSNIQAVFIRLENVGVNAGEVIIKQGEEGEHFYIISKGRCHVTTNGNDSDEQVKVAELSAGDTFGEEALLAASKRNATVTMATEGSLMRLKRSDFEELLKEPIIKSVSYDVALSLVNEGHILIDVRLKSEHKNECIEGSKNIPLNMLRRALPKLETDVSYIIYCDTGARSAAAAFLLNEHGLDAQILQGGLRSQSQSAA